MMMEKLFLSVLNMTMTASAVIVAVSLARLALKRAPKYVSYALWAVAGFRLVFPFSFEAVFSLLPIRSAPIASNIGYQAIPRIDTGIELMDETISVFLPAATPTASVNPLQIWIFIGLLVWVAGVSGMLLYCSISLFLLKRRLAGSVYHSGGYYEAQNLRTPFVIGFFHPRIYLPTGLTDDERTLILLHERTHIARHDHIVKMIAFLILCVHWFNPLVWAAFLLMSADQEMSCDERVLKELGSDVKTLYSRTLVRFAVKGRLINGSPLAFGEGGMKERIKNILKFHKASRVAVIAAVTLALILTIGLAVNRISEPPLPESSPVADEPEINSPLMLPSGKIDVVQLGVFGELALQAFREYNGIFSETEGGSIVIYTDGNVASTHSFDAHLWSGNPDGKQMTRADLYALARKGEQLTLEDFKEFKCHFTLHLMEHSSYFFQADDMYLLNVHADIDSKLFKTKLTSYAGAAGYGVDIRDSEVDKFLDTFPHSVREEGGNCASLGSECPITAQIKLPSISYTGLIVTLQNKTAFDYTYQYVYKLQKTNSKNGSHWYDVEYQQGAPGMEAIPRNLKAHLPINISVDWGELYGELSPGEYRLAMDFAYQNPNGGATVNDTLYIYFMIGDF